MGRTFFRCVLKYYGAKEDGMNRLHGQDQSNRSSNAIPDQPDF
jgi:hypothetical protein